MCEINSFTYVIYASILFVSVENDVIPFIWPLCVTLQLVSCAEDETLREMIEVAVHRLHDALSPAFWQATHSDVTGDAFVPPGDAFVPISYKNECFFFYV